MKTKVTIHHTAFFRVDPDNDYGRRTIEVETPFDCADRASWAAEAAFHDTNAPGARPKILKQEGRCYSMSCGDIAEVETHGDPVFLLCVSIGFRKITGGQFVRLVRAQREAQVSKPNEYWSMEWNGVKLLDQWEAETAACARFNPLRSEISGCSRRCQDCGQYEEYHGKNFDPVGLAFGGHDVSENNRERWDMSPEELR